MFSHAGKPWFELVVGMNIPRRRAFKPFSRIKAAAFFKPACLP
jgi:hypothetical protein